MAANVWRLAEVPHSRNFGFEQELPCGILANRCYAYVPTCLAGCPIETLNRKTKRKKRDGKFFK